MMVVAVNPETLAIGANVDPLIVPPFRSNREDTSKAAVILT